MAARWVCLDVGETLIDETRVWSIWADVLGIPRLTFMAAFGAVVARGGEHSGVFPLVGVTDWRAHLPAVQAAYGGFRPDDLYPDAIPSLDAFRAAGYRVAIIANQPAERTAELRALGVEAEVMAMSDEMGVAKPAPAFYARALALLGDRLPADKAAEWGLIWASVADDQLLTEAYTLAHRLAKGPTKAFGEIKRVLDAAALNTLDEQLELERRTQQTLGDTEDFREGVTAFLTKREAKFTDD